VNMSRPLAALFAVGFAALLIRRLMQRVPTEDDDSKSDKEVQESSTPAIPQKPVVFSTDTESAESTFNNDDGFFNLDFDNLEEDEEAEVKQTDTVKGPPPKLSLVNPRWYFEEGHTALSRRSTRKPSADHPGKTKKKKQKDDPTINIARHKCEYFYAMANYEKALDQGLSILDDPDLDLPAGGTFTLSIQDLVARCHIQLKQHTKALPLLQALNASNRRDSELMRLLGECYGALNDRDSARFWCKRAVLLAETNVRNWVALGRALTVDAPQDTEEWELGRLCWVQARQMTSIYIGRAKGQNAEDRLHRGAGVTAYERMLALINEQMPQSKESTNYEMLQSVDALRARLRQRGEVSSEDFDKNSNWKDQGFRSNAEVSNLGFLERVFAQKKVAAAEDSEEEDEKTNPMKM